MLNINTLEYNIKFLKRKFRYNNSVEEDIEYEEIIKILDFLLGDFYAQLSIDLKNKKRIVAWREYINTGSFYMEMINVSIKNSDDCNIYRKLRDLEILEVLEEYVLNII
jgi:hypothetical protein